MAALVRVQLADAALRSALVGPSGMVTQYVIRTNRQVENRAKLYAPVDTGNMRASMTSTVRVEGLRVIGAVGTPVEYALAVHEGQEAGTVTVRAHQVRGHPVRGSRGRVAYRVKGHTRGTHTRQQAARPGRPFLRRALEDVLR